MPLVEYVGGPLCGEQHEHTEPLPPQIVVPTPFRYTAPTGTVAEDLDYRKGHWKLAPEGAPGAQRLACLYEFKGHGSHG